MVTTLSPSRQRASVARIISISGMAGKTYSYRAAGVDVDAGNALVERIKPLARATARPGADAALGGFGGVFDLAACGYRDPLLIAATDGVGTKLLVADAVGRHDTVGIDLVAMCVNDLVVQGAEPLFFLDYLATGRLDVAGAEAIIKGIADGCRQAGCALIGGETAEMPGIYAGKQYDLAGFSVGAVERDRLIDGATIVPGDRVLGLASSGLHSNGFSLVRRIIADLGLAYDAPAPFDAGAMLGDALLTPTRIYVRPLLAALPAGIKGLAHITGGGLLENVPRALPKNCRAVLDAKAWPLPPVFRWLAEAGALQPKELARTFNCGIGMVAIVAPGQVAAVTKSLMDAGETIHEIGEIQPRANDEPQTEISGLGVTWPHSHA